METQEANQLAGKALDALAAALDQGHSQALKTYLETLARFHRYSWRNALLIANQRPEATRVAGYRLWQRIGRYVRQGERGIVILAPVVYRLPKPKSEGAEDSDTPDDEGTTEEVLSFRAVRVFDVAQTDGRPLPTLDRVRGDPRDYLERLKALIAERGIQLEYSDEIGNAEGASRGGTILVRPGLEPAAEFAVLAHELAHEMLHQGNSERPASRKVQETEAEATAFVVCQAVNLQTGTACTDYVQLYAGGKQTLAASLARIQQTAASIIEGIRVSEEPTLHVAA